MFKNLTAALLFILIATGSHFAQYQLVPAFPNLGFEQPLDLQSPNDGTNRIFVVTQSGKIFVFPNDSTVRQPRVFLDISDKVIAGGEMGLLGLAFHPDYKNNGYFYINYTAPSPLRSIIARYQVLTADRDSADKNSEKILFTVNQPYQNHNGGQVAFGPDGYLYIGLGDGGSAGDPQGNGQNRSVLLGKILRIDVNRQTGQNGYSIPPDNPYAGNTNGYREEIYAYGLRNPWRFSFDTVSKRVWTGDVGQDKYEEVDTIVKGGNYGWKIMEGLHCYSPSSGCDTAGLIKPIWEYEHGSQTGNSITGGLVYRGKKIPSLNGVYIYADFVSGRIWGLSFDSRGQVSNQLLTESGKNISSFGSDINNELYVCSFDGHIYRLTDAGPTLVADEQPAEYALADNFPNPFNPETNIEVSIKEKGEVRLEIYDLKGNLIDTVFNGTLNTGKYSFKWNAAGFPSGIYIYQVSAGNFQASKKMVLLK